MQNMKPHAALLASPGIGHLTPVLELAKTLVTNHGFHVTIFVVAIDQSSTAQTQLFKSPIPDLLDIVVLPSVDISALVGPSPSVVTNIVVMMHESLPLLRSAISEMKLKPTILIVDLFGTEAFAIADEFKMLKFLFNTSNAWFLAVTIYAPVVDRKSINEHTIDKKPLIIPGCKSLCFEDTLEAFLDQNDPSFEGFLAFGLEIVKADGILVNTWQDLESTTLKAFGDSSLLGSVLRAPVYPIGPLARVGSSSIKCCSGNEVISWLAKQPTESVIYVSFGSGGTLSAKQITELAWGLKLSQQRFVWVVRPPTENNASGSYFSVANGCDGNPDFLPDGFLTRTQEVGLVVPMWAPQADILAHSSVGGFLSHCGWNSTLESILNGVPMIAWPLYSEQYMNASMLSENLKIAVRSKASPSEGVVGREEIKMMVKKIMVSKEGHQMRERVKELRLSGEDAVRKSSGSSFKSLSLVARDCEMRMESLKAKSKGA